jgi:hypothetical protein
MFSYNKHSSRLLSIKFCFSFPFLHFTVTLILHQFHFNNLTVSNAFSDKNRFSFYQIPFWTDMYIYKRARIQSLRKSLAITIYRKPGGGRRNKFGFPFLSKNSSKYACTSHAGTSEHTATFYTSLLYQFYIRAFNFICFVHSIVSKSSNDCFIYRKFQNLFLKFFMPLVVTLVSYFLISYNR